MKHLVSGFIVVCVAAATVAAKRIRLHHRTTTPHEYIQLKEEGERRSVIFLRVNLILKDFFIIKMN